MTTNPYPPEPYVDGYIAWDDPRRNLPVDNGTMQDNVDTLASTLVGHRIIAVDRDVPLPLEEGRYYYGPSTGTALTLDDGTRVFLMDSDDCCAYTELKDIIHHLPHIDHAIMGVGTTDGFETWHIFADLGDVLELKVGWSCGNPFYYGYGFDLYVQRLGDEAAVRL